MGVCVRLCLESGELDPEIARLSSQGFSGCLSVVQFNSVAPLKAALLYPNTSPVVVIGSLAESTCGSPSPANPYPAETTHSLSGKVSSSLWWAESVVIAGTYGHPFSISFSLSLSLSLSHLLECLLFFFNSTWESTLFSKLLFQTLSRAHLIHTPSSLLIRWEWKWLHCDRWVHSFGWEAFLICIILLLWSSSCGLGLRV